MSSETWTRREVTIGRARQVLELRQAGQTWHEITMAGLVRDGIEGRALLRQFKLTRDSGGSYEIAETYDHTAINPRTGKRMGARKS